LSDLATRLGLVVAEIEPETQRRLQEISPSYLRMRNPVDIWGAALVKGIEAGYREGMEAVLADPNIDAVIPILMLSRETGLPSYEFLIELKCRYPHKPILVTYSGEEACFREARGILEPAGIPTFLHLEQPFEVLATLARCREELFAKT
jgi:acyl-CoA synthetase (NDP forming)